MSEPKTKTPISPKNLIADSCSGHSAIRGRRQTVIMATVLMLGACGAYDHGRDSAANSHEIAERDRTSTASESRGDAMPADRRPVSGVLTIYPETRISVHTSIDPSMTKLLGASEALEQRFSNIASDAILHPLRASGKSWAILGDASQVEDNGTNIVILQKVELKEDGTPYRVILTAQQGKVRWSKFTDRPSFIDIPGNVPILPGPKTPDGKEYWDPSRDSKALSDELAKHIKVGY